MRSRLFASILAACMLVLLAGATGARAEAGNLRVLFVANEPTNTDALRAALALKPGVGQIDIFNSFSATPTAEQLSPYDLVVGTGDSDYQDSTLWGNRLADYLDAGGALVQFAYDNWEEPLAHPAGRFESGAYPPFIPGDNQNLSVTLGTLLVPGSPFLANVGTFTTGDNTTTPLAPGATLLAKWSDGRNAIATKGRVLSTSAAATDIAPIEPAAQLVVNAGNFFTPTGDRAAALAKCKKKFKKKPKGKTKKQRSKNGKKMKKKLKRCKKKAQKLPA
jgi:hypothetical protein